MKGKMIFSYVLALFIGLLSFSSCQKEVDENQFDFEPMEEELISPNQFDFESFMEDLQEDPRYIDYVVAHANLFTHLEDQEIDLFRIRELMKEQRITDYCSMNMDLVKDIRGGKLFIDSYCNLRSASITLYQEVEELSLLTAEQTESLFALIRSGNNSRLDCLNEFQNSIYFTSSSNCMSSIAWMEFYGDGSSAGCMDALMDISIGGYDDCCGAGGSGCPAF